MRKRNFFSEARALLRAIVLFGAGTGLFLGGVVILRLLVVLMLGPFAVGGAELTVKRVGAMVAGRVPFPRPLVLIMGDSTASLSLNASLIEGASSLATVYGTPVDGFHAAKAMLDSGPAPACVVLSYSFQWDGPHREKFWRFFMPAGYFTDGDLRSFHQVASSARQSPGTWPLSVFLTAAWLSQRGLFHGYSLTMLQNAFFMWLTKPEQAKELRDRLAANQGSHLLADSTTYTGRRREFYEKLPFANGVEAFYFRRQIELFEERGVHVYLLELPFPPSVSKQESHLYFTDYEAFAQALSQRPLHFLRLPEQPQEDFIAAGHLTEAGAGRASRALREALARCYR